MFKPITIVGGGLAGLTLGIGLRRQGLPVTVREARHYPRHHVCGEFICGEGQSVLARLQLLGPLHEVGTRLATEAQFFVGSRPSVRLALPQPTLCISRYVLDAWLAATFQRLGGELLAGQRWSGTPGEGTILATGRRSAGKPAGWRWLALKVHARNLTLAADLEMHCLPQGYVGLCRLPGDEVNICGLFRHQEAVTGLRQQWRAVLGGTPGSVLHQRLGAATLDEDSFCAVAGFSLQPRRAVAQAECSVGDALTMIPPVTGNGMSMALESAELAMAPLVAYSRGEQPWASAVQQIAVACDQRFQRRLRWGGWLQAALFQPLARRALLALATCSPTLTQAFVTHTR